jgi:hypothetical protein
MTPNIHFEHVKNLVKTVTSAQDLQALIDSYEQVAEAMGLWEDLADVLREKIPDRDDPKLAAAILNDIEKLIATLDQFRKDVSARPVRVLDDQAKG